MWPHPVWWHKKVILFLWDVPQGDSRRFWDTTPKACGVERWFVERAKWTEEHREVAYWHKNLDAQKLRYSFFLKVEFTVCYFAILLYEQYTYVFLCTCRFLKPRSIL